MWVNLLSNRRHQPFHRSICADVISHFFYPMNDCGMISAANGFSNGLQRCICHIFAQIHGDLPRFCHIIASGFRGDLIHRNAKMFRNYLHHQLWCHFQRNIRRNNILKLLLWQTSVRRIMKRGWRFCGKKKNWTVFPWMMRF